MYHTKSLKYEPDARTNDFIDKNIDEKLSKTFELENSIKDCEDKISALDAKIVCCNQLQ